MTTKLQTLETILRKARVLADDGVVLQDFFNEGNEKSDFANVNRTTLFELMSRSYEAGKQAK